MFMRKSKRLLYVDNTTKQITKQAENSCGDYNIIKRTHDHTIYILCDGIGSGIKASIAATMCANRINSLIDSELPLPTITKKITKLMSRAKVENIPYSTFTIIKILNSGQFNIYNYDNPFPFLISKQKCLSFDIDYKSEGKEMIGHAAGRLYEGDSLIAMSDGVSQAGLGRVSGLGWGVENIKNYIEHLVQKGMSNKDLIDSISNIVRDLSGGIFNDDVTITKLTIRFAKTLNIITGPPKSKKDDKEFVKSFLSRPGKRIVCGSTTAELVARYLDEEIEVIENAPSLSNPPQYSINGIDYVSEGAVTLNQIYNLLDSNLENYDNENNVMKISKLIKNSDHISIFWGTSENIAHKDTSFIQMGILERKIILSLIIKKLKALGKTLDINKF